MIEIRGLGVRHGSFVVADINLSVATGQYAVLMGRSGSGKTTILEAIAGLRTIMAGSIHLGTLDSTFLPPAERDIGYVPQDGVLFETMSVRANLGFALSVRDQPTMKIKERVDELAAMLEIEHLLNRYPVELSGGEKQRVALGRALAARPTVLLLDEPLSSLDDEARDQLMQCLIKLREMRANTMLHVTHHRQEANLLADQLLHLEKGSVRTQNAV